jgi:hypothetical protein
MMRGVWRFHWTVRVASQFPFYGKRALISLESGFGRTILKDVIKIFLMNMITKPTFTMNFTVDRVVESSP